MANVKISELAELTTPAADDKMVIVDASEALDADKTKYITVSNLRAGPTFLTTPLTSTAWDGDSFSTTPKTKIDLSAVFGAPAGIKAVLVTCTLRDSGAASTDSWIILSTNGDDNYSGMGAACPPVNDRYGRYSIIVPCDENGDIYYRCEASGSNTLDVYLEIYGYWL